MCLHFVVTRNEFGFWTFGWGNFITFHFSISSNVFPQHYRQMRDNAETMEGDLRYILLGKPLTMRRVRQRNNNWEVLNIVESVKLLDRDYPLWFYYYTYYWFKFNKRQLSWTTYSVVVSDFQPFFLITLPNYEFRNKMSEVRFT